MNDHQPSGAPTDRADVDLTKPDDVDQVAAICSHNHGNLRLNAASSCPFPSPVSITSPQISSTPPYSQLFSLQDHDSITLELQQTRAVRYHNDCEIGELIGDNILHNIIGGHVDRRSSFVQYQDLGWVDGGVSGGVVAMVTGAFLVDGSR